MMRRLPSLLLATLALPACADPLSDAFSKGAAMGQGGNAAARSGITQGVAQSTVPHFTANPPQASYFGSPGLGTPATAKVGACAGEAGDPACDAVQFSQSNPSKRASFSIAPDDPLLTHARTITADPQAIAGNIAGTYSGCSVQTVTRPDLFETAICHQYRTIETATCDKVLVVTPIQTPGCSPGEFLTRVTADPCPGCSDYLAFDFTCGAGNYLMQALTIAKSNPSLYMELGSQFVPGTLGTEIGMTPGPSQLGGFFCYQTYYSQSCSGGSCSIGTWFYNPCQGTSFYGVSSFVMPTTLSFIDAWDNQCAALEARSK